MNRVWSAGMALAVFSGCLGAPPRLPTDWSAARESFLRPKIRQQDGEPVIAVGGEAVPASPYLSSFYARRSDHLAWNGASGPLPQVYELVQALGQAEEDGLPAAAYRLPAIEAAMGRRGAMAPTRRALVGLVELDLRCTNAFLLYADHLQGGRVSPQARDWPGGAAGEDPGQLLERALGNNRVGQALAELRPSHPEYARLQRALAEYRRIAGQGGWAALPAGGGLKKGQRHPAVAALRRHLAMVGDLDTAAAGSEEFDEELERAVRRFQRRHSLQPNGRVDASTLEALAVPVEERIAQIELNMERWRWLPGGKQARYILVRLDEFALDLVEEGQVSLSMRIVAGKDQWRTPIFSSPMTYVVFNPYWNVPPSIAVEEVLPALRQDPAYLEQKGLQVVRGKGDEARIIEADTLDWEAVPPDSLPYTFIQLPGPENPLGRMKFALPNEFDIYLHDTPNRELFARQERGFSHGCIRLEKSLELAVRLLEADPAWTRDRIQELIRSGKTQQLDLPRPIPVYFSYWTVWADEEGQVAFRPDLYGGEKRLREALADEVPTGK